MGCGPATFISIEIFVAHKLAFQETSIHRKGFRMNNSPKKEMLICSFCISPSTMPLMNIDRCRLPLAEQYLKYDYYIIFITLECNNLNVQCCFIVLYVSYNVILLEASPYGNFWKLQTWFGQIKFGENTLELVLFELFLKDLKTLPEVWI